MKEFYISSTKYTIQERKTQKNGKVYDVVFRIVTQDGTEKQKKLSGYKTKKLASEAYTDFVTQNCELLKGAKKKIEAQKQAEENSQKVSEAIEEYLSAMKNENKDSTIIMKEEAYRLHILPLLGDCCMSDLTRERIILLQDQIWNLKKENGAPYAYDTLKKIRGRFSDFLSWHADRYGTVNHLKSIRKPKRRLPKSEMLFWTSDQFKQFLDVCDNAMYKALFATLFYTGRRKGEVLALGKTDVLPSKIIFSKQITTKNLDKSPWKITSTKNEKRDATPICTPLQVILAEYDFPDGQFIFGGDKPIPAETLRRYFAMYTEKAGLPPIRIHDLRHSFVSMIIHLGAPLPLVADLIGDTLEQVVRTYSHLYPSDREEIIKKIQ